MCLNPINLKMDMLSLSISPSASVSLPYASILLLLIRYSKRWGMQDGFYYSPIPLVVRYRKRRKSKIDFIISFRGCLLWEQETRKHEFYDNLVLRPNSLPVYSRGRWGGGRFKGLKQIREHTSELRQDVLVSWVMGTVEFRYL